MGATEASLRKELEDARRAVSLERDKLEATQEAVRCLEAIAAASATENEAAREEQIRESAANQSRLEAALKRSEEAKVEKEEACNEAIKRADGAKEEVLSLTAELERERIISRQRAEEMEVMARRLAASEAAAASGSSGQGSRGGGDAEVEGKLTAAIQAKVYLERSSARSLLSSASAMSTLLKQASAAAPGLSEKVSTTASSLADKWFVEGRTANENGDASKACELFSQAFIVCPRPSLLLSIANMRLKLDEPLAAIELYRIVLPEAPIPSDVPDVVDAAAPAVDVGDDDGEKEDRSWCRKLLVTPPTEKEVAMALRKEPEAQAAAAAASSRVSRRGSEELAPLAKRNSAHMEQIAAELRQAKAELAHANAERAALNGALVSQQKLQRKARMGKLKEQEKRSKLEVRLMTRASNESEEVAKLAELLKQQGEEMKVLQAKVSADI